MANLSFLCDRNSHANDRRINRPLRSRRRERGETSCAKRLSAFSASRAQRAVQFRLEKKKSRGSASDIYAERPKIVTFPATLVPAATEICSVSLVPETTE